MKYIDSEKLIAEIDKILAKVKKAEEIALLKKDASGHLIATTKTLVCAKINRTIKAIQQEQPEVNLEKEIEKQIRSIFYDLDGIAIMGTSKYASVDDMEYVARHFFELGKNSK